MVHYFEEEAFKYFTLNDFKELVLMDGPAIFDAIEKYAPEVYEAWSAHKANKEIEEFLSTRKRDEDYYND